MHNRHKRSHGLVSLRVSLFRRTLYLCVVLLALGWSVGEGAAVEASRPRPKLEPPAVWQPRGGIYAGPRVKRLEREILEAQPALSPKGGSLTKVRFASGGFDLWDGRLIYAGEGRGGHRLFEAGYLRGKDYGQFETSLVSATWGLELGRGYRLGLGGEWIEDTTELIVGGTDRGIYSLTKAINCIVSRCSESSEVWLEGFWSHTDFEGGWRDALLGLNGSYSLLFEDDFTLDVSVRGIWDDLRGSGMGKKSRLLTTIVVAGKFLLTNSWSLRFGVRMDGTGQGKKSHVLNPLLGMSWVPHGRVGLEIMAEPRVRFPLFDELYLPEKVVEVEPELKAERELYSVTAKGRVTIDGGNSIEAFLSTYKVEDFISWEDSDYDRLINLRNTSAKITQAGVTINNSIGEVMRHSLWVAATRAKEVDSGEGVNYLPSVEAGWTSSFSLPRGVGLDLKGEYVGPRFYRLQDKLDDYVQVNLKLSKRISGKAKIFLIGHNLTDRRFEVVRGIRHRGRTVLGGIKGGLQHFFP